MNKFIILFVLVVTVSCKTEKQPSKKTNVIAKVELPKTNKVTITNNIVIITDELYTLQIQIEKTKNNQHNLIIDIKLHNGSSFISPFEKKDFTGKFYMDLGSYKNLSFDGSIIETPKAISRHDGFKNAQVIWVEKNTSYKQTLNVLSKENFEVFGRVQFTIEPRCSLEQIPFGISYKDGGFSFFDPKC